MSFDFTNSKNLEGVQQFIFLYKILFSIFGGQLPLPPNEKCIPWRKKWVSLGFIGGDAHAPNTGEVSEVTQAYLKRFLGS
ncbi:unnamed protein product, partial [Vitis vinifera]|uniref:Uncharacterized protein n=1 Tax=Vitis vinifera TaxID=29760 RepID=D7U7J9_VITVI